MKRAIVRAAVSLALIALSACRDAAAPAPTMALPDLQGVAGRAREEIESAHAAVVERPLAPDRWTRLAIFFLEHEFIEESGTAYAIARELDPTNYRWPFAFGCRVAENDPISALPILEEAIAIEPRREPLHVVHARTLDRLGRLQDAIDAYRRAVELDPTDPDARAGLARLLLENDEIDAARGHLDAALERSPSSRAALNVFAELHRRTGDADAAAEMAARADAAPPVKDLYDLGLIAARANAPGGQVVLARARVMRRNGRGVQADELLDEFVSLNPDNVFAHISRGQYFIDTQRLGQGLADLHAAVGLAPELSDAKLALADGLRMAGRLEDAIGLYESLLAERADLAAARRGLAACQARLGQVDDAVASFSALIAEDPTDEQAAFALSMVEYGRGNFAAVVEVLLPLVPGDDEPMTPAGFRALSSIGLAQLQLDRMADAADTLRRVVDADPRQLETRRGLAVALGATGRGREAAAVLREGLALTPNDPTLVYELAWLLATHPDDAARDGAEAVRLAEALAAGGGAGRPDVLDLLACAYAEDERYGDAAAVMERALELARQGSPPGMVAALENRLALFESGRAFRDQR